MATKKNGRISITAFTKAVSENYSKTTTLEWCDLRIEVKRNLNLDEMMLFVDNTIKACFSEENNTYRPQMKDFAIRLSIVAHYTNLTLPSNIHKAYELVYGSDLVEEIVASIDKLQFNAIMRAIDDNISNIVNSNVALINKQIDDLHSAMENMQEQFASIFANVSADDIKGIIGAISEGGIDEKKLVEAYLSGLGDKNGES